MGEISRTGPRWAWALSLLPIVGIVGDVVLIWAWRRRRRSRSAAAPGPESPEVRP